MKKTITVSTAFSRSINAEHYAKIVEMIISDKSLDNFLDFLAQQLENDIADCKASFLLLSRDNSHFTCVSAPSLGQRYQQYMNDLGIEKKTGTCGDAITYNRLCVFEDITQSEQWQPYLDFAKEKNIGAAWSYPISDNDNNVLGSLDVYCAESRSPNDTELAVLQEISKLAYLCIKYHRANMSSSLSSLITYYLPIGILVTDQNLDIIEVNPALCNISGFDKSDLIGQKPVNFSSGSYAMKKLNNALKNLETGQSWTVEMDFKKKSGEFYTAETCITVIRDANGYINRSIALITDITERKRSEKTIEYQAHYDLLTHLPNRHSFYKQLNKSIERARVNNASFYTMLLDLDHFKEINDSIGHEYGDELLRLIAQRLETLLEEDDVVARLGGDEFGFIFGSRYEYAQIVQIADTILEKVAHPLSIKTMSDSYISSSIGIAYYPQDGKNIEELLKSADQAMYESKSKGRNSYTFFTTKLKEEAQKKAILHRELRIALYEKPEQFSLFFQPIVKSHNAELIQLEALLRWQHPEQGLISPADFIPLAEKTGLASKLGEIVQQQACKSAAELKQKGIKTKVSINFSNDEFKNEAIGEHFLAQLKHYGLCAEDVVIEITESLFAEDETRTLKHLTYFRDNGIHIAIDDFGTGYSSLSYLASFPIDELKIDRVFVSNIHNDKRKQSLVSAIINIGHRLGMYIVAEGVEQAEELDFLEQQKCDLIQGYFFDKPMPLADILRKYTPN